MFGVGPFYEKVNINKLFITQMYWEQMVNALLEVYSPESQIAMALFGLCKHPKKRNIQENTLTQQPLHV